MDIQNLKSIIDGLVNQFGNQGACDYISTGDYPYELKALALSMIRQKEENPDIMVTNSEYIDIDNPWGSSFETFYYAS